MKYILPGRPIPLRRPRLGKGKTYDSQAQLKNSYSLILRQQHGNQPLYSGQLKVDCDFYFKAPKRMKNPPQYYIGNLDIDNLLKLSLDCMNGIVILDDRFVVSTLCRKMYGEPERTEITVKEIDEAISYSDLIHPTHLRTPS